MILLRDKEMIKFKSRVEEIGCNKDCREIEEGEMTLIMTTMMAIINNSLLINLNLLNSSLMIQVRKNTMILNVLLDAKLTKKELQKLQKKHEKEKMKEALKQQREQEQ